MRRGHADAGGDLLLGIDVGSQSTKGVLCTPAGRLIAEARRQHVIDRPRPGWAEQDADAVWWSDVAGIAQELVAAAAEEGGRIAAVGISALGPALVPVGDDGRPLRPAILYGVDTRSAPQVAALEARHGREAIQALCGNRLSTQSLGPKILWLRETEPEIARRTRTFLTAGSYLVHRLTGERIIDRHTASHSGPLIDLEAMAWSDRFADSIATADELPRIGSAQEIAGTVTPEAAEATGIPAGTPVTVGGSDTIAESTSVGVVAPGDVMIMYGSSGFLLLVGEERRSHPDLWTTAGVFGDRWGLAGGLATAGSATAWFRDTLAPELVAARDAGGPPAYAPLAEEAAASPRGARGVLFLPYLSGERTPLNDPDARGVVAGLTLSHTRGDLYRALLEGVAFAIRHNLDAMIEAGGRPSRPVAVGGGTLNRLWMQIVSDVTGLAQALPERTIGASAGDAFFAGLAIGLIDGPEALARGWVRVAEVIEPDPEATAAYEPMYRRFRDLYPATRDLVHELAAIGRG